MTPGGRKRLQRPQEGDRGAGGGGAGGAGRVGAGGAWGASFRTWIEPWSVSTRMVRPPVPTVPRKRRGRIPWLAVRGKSVSTEPASVVASSVAFSLAGSSSVTAPFTVLTSTLPGSAKPEIAACTEPFTFFASTGPALVCALIAPFTVWALMGALAPAMVTSPFTVNASTFTPRGTRTVNCTRTLLRRRLPAS